MWQCHPRGAWREVHGRGHSHVRSWSNTRRPRGLLVCAFSASSLPRPSIPTPLTLSPNGPASYFRGTRTVRRLSRDCPSAPGLLLLPPPASEMPSLPCLQNDPPSLKAKGKGTEIPELEGIRTLECFLKNTGEVLQSSEDLYPLH